MWFVFALITALAWGGADLFYKKGSDEKTPYTHLRITVMVGLVMGVYAILYWVFNALFLDNIIKFDIMSIVVYLPVSFFYILSMILGYVGLRYLMLSIASPVQNSSGAIVFFLYLILYPEMPGVLTIVGVLLSIIGVIGLGVIEKKSSDKELAESGETVSKKYRSGFVALIFPLMYAILDSMGTFLDGIYLDDDAAGIRESISGHSHWIGDGEAFMAYSITFMVCAILCFIYIKFIKKQPYPIKAEGSRFTAGCFETLGEFFYIFSMAEESVIAAPIVATYCIFSVIFSAVFLKERLSRSQLAVIATVIVGIAVIGISEAL